MVKVHTYFDPPGDPGLCCDDPSLAQQHFKDEADINVIVERYKHCDGFVDPTVKVRGELQFGDFSSVPDFLDAQNVVSRSIQAFEALPPEIRKRFSNDPAEMLAFLDNEENRIEAENLGLVVKKEVLPPPLVPPEPKV